MPRARKREIEELKKQIELVTRETPVDKLEDLQQQLRRIKAQLPAGTADITPPTGASGSSTGSSTGASGSSTGSSTGASGSSTGSSTGSAAATQAASDAAAAIVKAKQLFSTNKSKTLQSQDIKIGDGIQVTLTFRPNLISKFNSLIESIVENRIPPLYTKGIKKYLKPLFGANHSFQFESGAQLASIEKYLTIYLGREVQFNEGPTLEFLGLNKTNVSDDGLNTNKASKVITLLQILENRT